MTMREAIKAVREALDNRSWGDLYEVLTAAEAEAEKQDADYQRAREAWLGYLHRGSYIYEKECSNTLGAYFSREVE